MDYNMKYIKAVNAADAYKQLTHLIDNEGVIIESRNELTKEVLNVAVEIENPRDRIINIEQFNLPFILQETFDILNSNAPRVIHSREMLQKTMGNSSDPMFFGNELRQALSRWSLYRIYQRFLKDKNTRKAVLDLGNRRPIKHTPCMLFSHFIIRDDKFYMTSETRGTAVSMGFINDIFLLTLIQEILYSWLKPHYPELKMGTFMYKTVSLHEYVNEVKSIDAVAAVETLLQNNLQNKATNDEEIYQVKYVPTWNQFVKPYDYHQNPIDLSYSDYIREMGTLYFYIDDYMKASKIEDIDKGNITLIDDILEPQKENFKTKYFYNWAKVLYNYTKDPNCDKSLLLRFFNNYETPIFRGPSIEKL